MTPEIYEGLVIHIFEAQVVSFQFVLAQLALLLTLVNTRVAVGLTDSLY